MVLCTIYWYFISAADVWFVGDSIVYWAGVRAASRGRVNLGLPEHYTVGWYGIRGMSWGDFTHSLQLRVLFQPPPKVILINLGGNDLCCAGILRIFSWIRQGIDYIVSAYPSVQLIWCDILQRLHWGDSRAVDIVIESKRRRVNRYGHERVMQCSNGHILSHDIDYQTPGFFRADGVHLSEVGLEMYIDASRDKILSLV